MRGRRGQGSRVECNTEKRSGGRRERLKEALVFRREEEVLER